MHAGSADSRRKSITMGPGNDVTARGRRPHARGLVVAALAAVAMMTVTLAGCSAGALNGHSAPTFSALSAGASGSAAPAASGSRLATAPGSGGRTQSATTQPSRPPRPDSVLLGPFKSTLFPQPCATVATGSSDTVFTFPRLVKQGLCFAGLQTPVPPSIIITTPDGTRETMPLLISRTDLWMYVVDPVPGQGPEASLGEYAFQVTTTIAGTGSSNASLTTSPSAGGPSPSITTSPAASVVTTSGHFTVIPATEPSVAVGSDPLTAGQQASVSAGGQLHIWFSGFPSFSLVWVSLYGPGAALNYPWLADLPVVKTDQHGEGDATWTVPPGAATAWYAVWTDPPLADCSNLCAAFSVTP
jgi:hypothetical protein